MTHDQQNLFGDLGPAEDRTYGIEFEPRDHRVARPEAARLSRQCRAILRRLRTSPASNIELAEIARKYTGRISDLRAAGYDVRVVGRGAHGLRWYQLFER